MIMYNPWFQLVASLISMIMIANLQYAWTLFVNPLQEAAQWELPTIQLAFTMLRNAPLPKKTMAAEPAVANAVR
jgi:hypothetical protein